MDLKRIAAVAVLAAGLIGAGATSASASTTSTAPATGTPATCLPPDHDGPWPVSVNGRPARDAGVRVWHDTNGWHVRVTHGTIHDRVFSGEITTEGTLVDVHPVRLEKNDYLVVGPHHHGLRFRFNNYGGVDGFDFATHCAPALAFGLVTDGHLVRPVNISIGADGHHPTGNPFVIRRTA